MMLQTWTFIIWVLVLQCLGRMVLGVGDYSRAEFPADFVFGAGSSAYQVEGAAFEDGRTASILDTFAHGGYDFEGNGDIACDQYHKYKEDVKLMVQTGLEAYRFSISWSRLIPNGRGPVNPKGVEYYNNLINELIMHGIQPHVTISHMDIPQALEDEYGGWLSQKIVKDFTIYADVCFKEFGDRVFHWTTLNEPNVYVLGGYGIASPGQSPLPSREICPKGNSSSDSYTTVHNILLAHSSAAKLYRKKYQAIQHGFVGINIYAPWFFPTSNATEDLIAAKSAIGFAIGWVIHPLIYGDYPNITINNGTRIPVFTDYQSKLVKGSLDFIGVNHYYSVYVRCNSSLLEMNSRDLTTDTESTLIFKQGDTPPGQFPLLPFSLYQVLEYIKQTYGNPPVYIHENGQEMRRNGTLCDTPRVKYLHAYIGAVLEAIRNGSNTRGYFHWSFLDGYELLDGYQSSYGLYYVDLDDKELRRYPKLSAHWYSNFIKGRSTSLNEEMEDENDRIVSSISKASQ